MIQKSRLKRLFYIALGLFFLGLSYFGIIMPGIPAIPFILLSLFFIANSSERLHNWMMRQKIINKIVARKNQKKGNLWFKLFVISQLWVSIIVAEFLFINNLLYGIILASIGLVFSVFTFILLDK